MKSSDYYGIQFMQSRYLLMWENGMFDTILEEVFSSEEDISICYYGFQGKARGRKAVDDFFSRIKEKVIRNGSILRNDLPASQYIQVMEDKMTAKASWITMSAEILGPAYGNEEPPYPYPYHIGIYQNIFVKEKEEWRLKHLDWKPLIDVGENWRMNPKTCVGLYYSNPEKWPGPFEKHSYVFEEPTSKDDANIQVRTRLFQFAHEFTYWGKRAVTEDMFLPEAAEQVCSILPETKSGFHGTMLLTSPIVSLSEDLEQAEMFMNTALILPDGDFVIHSKGRICTRLKRIRGKWKFETFQWYKYASLDPWKMTGFYPELFEQFQL